MRNEYSQRPRTGRLIGLIVCLCLAGCGMGGSEAPEIPEKLIPVRGEVTLDGEPLAGALVLFLPPENQVPWRESKAVTDAEGKYELTYFGEAKGAAAGLHKVKITCPDPNDIERQIVPAKYNVDSTLMEDVSPERKVINFELQGN